MFGPCVKGTRNRDRNGEVKMMDRFTGSYKNRGAQHEKEPFSFLHGKEPCSHGVVISVKQVLHFG